METKVTVDWYSGTFHETDAANLMRVLQLGKRLEISKFKPQFGYTSSVDFESGARIMWNNDRPEMGYHLVLSGSALRWVSGAGQDVLSVLDVADAHGARCSRVDLAIDVFDSGMQQADLCKPNRMPYKGKGRTPKFTHVGDQEDGWTLYVGSRSSDKFLRVYDKGKETGDGTADWVRIEVECKGMVAHWLGTVLPRKSASDLYTMCSELVRGMVTFNVDAWNKSLSMARCELSLPKKTDRDTLGWLVNSCAPALARIIAEKPNEDVFGAFETALRGELAKYKLTLG